MSDKGILEQLLALLFSVINGETSIEDARAKAIELGKEIDTAEARELLEQLEADPT